MKLLHVDFTQINDRVSYSYITITKHPLEDLKPLAMLTENKEIVPLIDIQYDVLFVSNQLPICILYDDAKNKLIFATLRSNESEVSFAIYS